jgi:hypothetical protein
MAIYHQHVKTTENGNGTGTGTGTGSGCGPDPGFPEGDCCWRFGGFDPRWVKIADNCAIGFVEDPPVDPGSEGDMVRTRCIPAGGSGSGSGVAFKGKR